MQAESGSRANNLIFRESRKTWKQVESTFEEPQYLIFIVEALPHSSRGMSILKGGGKLFENKYLNMSSQEGGEGWKQCQEMFISTTKSSPWINWSILDSISRSTCCVEVYHPATLVQQTWKECQYKSFARKILSN